MHIDSHDTSLLETILYQNSVRVGSFTLASGQHTDIYVDAKLTTCAAQAISLVARVFIQKMRELGWSPRAVGGLTIGADPIAFSIAGESSRTETPINAFVVRKEAKKHGMQRHIEGIENVSDLPVVIIDDVCTTGDSTAIAIEKAHAAGMNILGAMCLVDREMGAASLIANRFGLNLEHIFTLSDLRRHYNESHHAPEVIEANI